MRGGKPAVVNLSLTLKEAYIHTRDEYDISNITDITGSDGSEEVSETADGEGSEGNSVAQITNDGRVLSQGAIPGSGSIGIARLSI